MKKYPHVLFALLAAVPCQAVDLPVPPISGTNAPPAESGTHAPDQEARFRLIRICSLLAGVKAYLCG